MDHTPPDIWDTTYQNDTIRTLPGVSLLTAINETDGQRRLVARMDIEQRDPDSAIRLNLAIDMTPAQMRALAALLQTHADRVEQVLIPLLQPAPEIIPFALYHEPEAA